LRQGFLGTAAPRVADLMRLLEIAMGVGLLLALGSRAHGAFDNTPAANQ